MDRWGEEAWYLPLGVVWDESNLAINREDKRRAQEAILMQTVVATVLSKSAHNDFKEAIANLNKEVAPIEPPEPKHEYMTWDIPTDD